MTQTYDFKYRPLVLVALVMTVVMAWWYRRDVEIIVTVEDDNE